MALASRWNRARYYLRLLRSAGGDVSARAWLNALRSGVLTPLCRRFGPDRLPFGPTHVYLLLTEACNRRCRFCSYRDELKGPKGAAPIMELELFGRLLASRELRGALSVHFHGGEPLLHEDLPEMIRGAREQGHLVAVLTNGVLLADRAPEWKQSPPHALSISYDPATASDIADGLSRVPPGVVVKLSLVISRKRLGLLEPFFDFAREQHVDFLEVANLQQSADRDDEPVAREDAAFAEARRRIETSYGRDHSIFWPPLADPAARPEDATCDFFWNKLFLGPGGTITPCCTLPLETYRDGEGALAGAWNGPRLVEARRRMRLGEPPSYCVACSYLHYDELP